MTTLSVKMLRIPTQKILILSFLHLFLFGFSGRALAQKTEELSPKPILSESLITSPSSTSIEERIRILEQKVQSLENKPKDFWDKLSAISALVSGLTIALIGYWATNTYKQREIAISQVQIVRDLMAQLQSKERRDVQAALGLIGCSGSPDIVTVLAAVYQNEVEAIAALSGVVNSTQDQTVKRKAQRALNTLLKSFKQLTFAEQRFHDLASEYEQTRELPAGNDRTQKMEAVFTAMKGLSPIGQTLLPTLINGKLSGDWLSAIAILQETPNSDYLDWLAKKIAEDPGAFHGYQAAVALRKAIWVLGEEQVKPSITLLRDSVVKAGRHDLLKEDAFKVLRPPRQLVFQWAKEKRAENPHDMGSKNYERCSFDLGYPGWEHDLLKEENGTLKYQ